MIEALNDWNVWWKDKNLLTPRVGRERESLKTLENWLRIKEIKVVTGIRRSGKSTLFYQLINKLLQDGVEPQKILLVNFEDDVLSKHTLKEIVDFYQSSKYDKDDFYLFLDEIHRCPEWELYIRKLYDTGKKIQIFVTDSSSKFVQNEYSAVFTGRNVKLLQYPLSFKEYLSWKGLPTGIKEFSSSDINSVRKALKEYAENGGFPEIFFKEETFRKQLLKEYFNDILYKDIIERFRTDIQKTKDLAMFLLSNLGSPFSVRKYSRMSGISLETIEKYLNYFEEVFLLFRLPKFDYSLKSQEVTQKKIYSIDNGLAVASNFRFMENMGKIYENIVFTELKRRGKDFYYWKDANQHETDFVIKDGLKITEAINVCFRLDDIDTKEREVDSLLSALKEFKLQAGIIITENFESEEKTGDRTIRYIPLWKWLLQK